MYINTFKYTPKDVSCQLCTEYVKKLGCTALRCPWLAERIEAGVVGYREAVLETFPHERRLFQRLNLLIKHYPGSLWSNEQHERRIDEAANNRLEQMMPELMKSAGVTESLKASDPMKWVGLMNTLKAQAEETILTELVFS